MNSLLQECINLNAEAIVHMKAGRHVESSLTIRNALEKLDVCFKMSQDHANDYYHQSQSHCPHTYTSVSIENAGTERIKATSATNNFIFYPRMFHVTSTGQSKIDLRKTLLILMFNEAVSRHIIACSYVNEHKVNPHQYLYKVSKLYETVVKAARVSLPYQNAKEMLCLIMAATNNFGHIASQLMMFQETTSSIDYMIKLLGMSNVGSFGADDINLFFESVCIFLEGRNLRIAPAA